MQTIIRPVGAFAGLEESTGLYEGMARRLHGKARHKRVSAAPRIETHSVVDPSDLIAEPPSVDAALATALQVSRLATSDAATLKAQSHKALNQAEAHENKAARLAKAHKHNPTPEARKAVGKNVLAAAGMARKSIKAGLTAQKHHIAAGLAKAAISDLTKAKSIGAKAKVAQKRNPGLATALAKQAIQYRDRGTANLKRGQMARRAPVAVPVPPALSQERLAAAGRTFGLRVKFAGRLPGQGAPVPAASAEVHSALDGLGSFASRVKSAMQRRQTSSVITLPGGNYHTSGATFEQIAGLAGLYGVDGIGVMLAAAELGELGALGDLGFGWKSIKKGIKKGLKSGAGAVVGSVAKSIGLPPSVVNAAMGGKGKKGKSAPAPVQAAAAGPDLTVNVAPQIALGEDEAPWWKWPAIVGGATVALGGGYLLWRRSAA